MNITFRAQVRVVDFYPPRLADFAQSLDDPRYNNAPDLTLDDDDDSMNLTPQSRWEWAFWITVEDALKSGEQTAPDRLRVLVHGKDAQYLLKLDACDLRRAPEVLRKLRDRLFLFWGELEEVKSKSKPNAEVPSPKNRLLECCIREYGVKDDDDKWIRMHRITGTTIQEE
jgi:protection-of-telomeres protein 1